MNRGQIRDCVALMSKLVLAIVTIMMDHPETLWGDACYPAVEGKVYSLFKTDCINSENHKASFPKASGNNQRIGHSGRIY